MSFGSEFAPQRGNQTHVLGLGAGEQQRVQAQHDCFVVVMPAAGRQHGADALVQFDSMALSVSVLSRLPRRPALLTIAVTRNQARQRAAPHITAPAKTTR